MYCKEMLVLTIYHTRAFNNCLKVFCQPIAIILIPCEGLPHLSRGVLPFYFPCLLTTAVWDLSSSERLRLWVRLPEDQADRLDVAAIVTAMEADDLLFGRHKDLDPAGRTTTAPLPLLDLAIAVVHETDAKDVALAALVADEHLDGADHLLWPNLVQLRVNCGTIHRVDCLTLDIACEDELKLVQVRVGLDTKAAKLDTLAKVHLLQVLIVRPLELSTRRIVGNADDMGLRQLWSPVLDATDLRGRLFGILVV